MIVPLDSATDNSPAEDYDLFALNEVGGGDDERLSCFWCHRPDHTGEQVIERFMRRPAGATSVTVRPRRPLCTDCIDALGLDWCVGCNEWNPADLIDAETELCPDCLPKAARAGLSSETAPPRDLPWAAGLVADMAEVERCYSAADEDDGWLRFRGNIISDWATVAIPREGDDPRDFGWAVCLGTSARFPGDVFKSVAALWMNFPLARKRLSAGGAA